MTVLKDPDSATQVAQRKAGSRATRALNEVGRRIQAFTKLTNDPAALEAYRTAMRVVVEVRDSEKQL